VLLAAGASRRLGHPKALVRVNGKTLLARTTQALADAGLGPIVIVVGAEVDLAARADLPRIVAPVHIVHCAAWRDGMGRSLATGIGALAALGRAARPAAACVTTVDQPAVDAAHLGRLADAYGAGGCPFVASTYAGVRGVPAIFAEAVWPELVALTADHGARALLRAAPSARCAEVPLRAGERDLDDALDHAHFTEAHDRA
jgi:molybdenum cofactor cytidylyltransferase